MRRALPWVLFGAISSSVFAISPRRLLEHTVRKPEHFATLDCALAPNASVEKVRALGGLRTELRGIADTGYLPLEAQEKIRFGFDVMAGMASQTRVASKLLSFIGIFGTNELMDPLLKNPVLQNYAQRELTRTQNELMGHDYIQLSRDLTLLQETQPEVYNELVRATEYPYPDEIMLPESQDSTFLYSSTSENALSYTTEKSVPSRDNIEHYIDKQLTWPAPPSFEIAVSQVLEVENKVQPILRLLAPDLQEPVRKYVYGVGSLAVGLSALAQSNLLGGASAVCAGISTLLGMPDIDAARHEQVMESLSILHRRIDGLYDEMGYVRRGIAELETLVMQQHSETLRLLSVVESEILYSAADRVREHNQIKMLLRATLDEQRHGRDIAIIRGREQDYNELWRIGKIFAGGYHTDELTEQKRDSIVTLLAHAFNQSNGCNYNGDVLVPEFVLAPEHGFRYSLLTESGVVVLGDKGQKMEFSNLGSSDHFSAALVQYSVALHRFPELLDNKNNDIPNLDIDKLREQVHNYRRFGEYLRSEKFFEFVRDGYVRALSNIRSDFMKYWVEREYEYVDSGEIEEQLMMPEFHRDHNALFRNVSPDVTRSLIDELKGPSVLSGKSNERNEKSNEIKRQKGELLHGLMVDTALSWVMSRHSLGAKLQYEPVGGLASLVVDNLHRMRQKLGTEGAVHGPDGSKRTLGLMSATSKYNQYSVLEKHGKLLSVEVQTPAHFVVVMGDERYEKHDAPKSILTLNSIPLPDIVWIALLNDREARIESELHFSGRVSDVDVRKIAHKAKPLEHHMTKQWGGGTFTGAGLQYSRNDIGTFDIPSGSKRFALNRNEGVEHQRQVEVTNVLLEHIRDLFPEFSYSRYYQVHSYIHPLIKIEENVYFRKGEQRIKIAQRQWRDYDVPLELLRERRPTDWQILQDAWYNVTSTVFFPGWFYHKDLSDLYKMWRGDFSFLQQTCLFPHEQNKWGEYVNQVSLRKLFEGFARGGYDADGVQHVLTNYTIPSIIATARDLVENTYQATQEVSSQFEGSLKQMSRFRALFQYAASTAWMDVSLDIVPYDGINVHQLFKNDVGWNIPEQVIHDLDQRIAILNDMAQPKSSPLYPTMTRAMQQLSILQRNR